jgi:Family of unknown function (DUF5996)
LHIPPAATILVMAASDEDWPDLPYEAWLPTRQTLHMYMQIIGKVRLALAPMEPQWGQVPLYLTARGLNTSPIPHPAGIFDIDIDLIDHVVSVRTVRGSIERIRLEPRSVADFYAELMAALTAAGVPVTITELPSEVPDAIPFPEDVEHASYEPEFANRFWRVLVWVDAVMKEHRARFRGKTSPVQLFWGTFDLAYSRFSGRPVEVSPDADAITRYGGDAEQACAGFWPGDTRLAEPAFFAYTYPSPAGIEQGAVKPEAARWNAEMGEFLLPYEAVRTAADSRQALLDFFETTYRAGAGSPGWD